MRGHIRSSHSKDASLVLKRVKQTLTHIKSGLESVTACMKTVRGNFKLLPHDWKQKSIYKKKRDPLDLELQLRFK